LWWGWACCSRPCSPPESSAASPAGSPILRSADGWSGPPRRSRHLLCPAEQRRRRPGPILVDPAGASSSVGSAGGDGAHPGTLGDLAALLSENGIADHGNVSAEGPVTLHVQPHGLLEGGHAVR